MPTMTLTLTLVWSLAYVSYTDAHVCIFLKMLTPALTMYAYRKAYCTPGSEHLHHPSLHTLRNEIPGPPEEV